MVRSAARPRVSNHLAVDGLAVILRDAAKTPLLRMRAEIYSQPLRVRSALAPSRSETARTNG
jgi:hypothetical protein